jgi:hypothetical protein
MSHRVTLRTGTLTTALLGLSGCGVAVGPAP